VPGEWAFGRPLWLQVALDLIAIGLCTASLEGVSAPEVLLHGVWVILAFDAFAFGLRPTGLRIILATLVVLVYSRNAPGVDLSEWPLMVVIAVVIAVMADRLSSTSRRYASLYRQTSARLVTAQEDERQRMARDLHDGVGQTLTAMTLTLDAAESMLWAGDNPPSELGRTAVRRAQELAAVALEEAHDIALRIRPARLQETGLVAAVSELVARAGGPVDLRVDPALLRRGLLAPATEVEALRIVQEALTNSLRHARAGTRWLAASRIEGLLRLEVGDDGVGFDTAVSRPTGLGLASMADRASLIDGRLYVVSSPGAGTVITLDIPLPPSPQTTPGPDELEASTLPTRP
jgi:signal transduction histidine kinase